jgi:hypothetical protein
MTETEFVSSAALRNRSRYRHHVELVTSRGTMAASDVGFRALLQRDEFPVVTRCWIDYRSPAEFRNHTLCRAGNEFNLK